MGQTTYNTRMTEAVAGMLADSYQDFDIVSYACSENIPFGALCVLDLTNDTKGGTVMLPKSTGTTIEPVAGFAMFVDTLQNQLAPTANVGHLANTVIPVIRKGRVYAAYFNAGANALSPLGVPNLWHPSSNVSNNAQYRGFMTTDTPSAVVGSEITAMPAGIRFIRDIGVSGVCLVDVSFPNG